MPDQYSLIAFVFGLLIVLGHSLQRFNEPSFPNQENVPHTLIPLRYMFFKSAYQRARLTYLTGALAVYTLSVALGHDTVSRFMGAGTEQAWPLAVALIMTGVSVAPPSLKWLNKVEDLIRQWVHTWFLVPDGVERTIGVLEDADYKPSATRLSAVDSPLREHIQENLKFPRKSVRYRWARAAMLMESLKQIRAGADHVLKKDTFEPFEADFEEINAKYSALEPKLSTSNPEDALADQVEKLLRRIYAYISWGTRYEADSQKAVDDKLEELGFRIPTIGSRRLFDIVAPPILLIAGITMVFYLAVDILCWVTGSLATFSQCVVNALISTIVASVMYGCTVYIALRERAKQIEKKTWSHGSPTHLIPIAIRAGFVTLVVIIVTTILWRFSAIVQSVPELVKKTRLLSFPAVAADNPAPWNLLPVKITAALPWFLVGATVSVLLAYFLGGDVRRTDRGQRLRDAKILGIALGLAGAAAQLIQISFAVVLGADQESLLREAASVATEGFAGLVCGAIIGFMVPSGYRQNIMAPPDHTMAGALRDLLCGAKTVLGDEEADNWVFGPNEDLLGISPAEAVQYEGLATGVQRLLKSGNEPRSDRLDSVSAEMVGLSVVAKPSRPSDLGLNAPLH